ncbi:hypothetical protein LEP1GSC194_4182 [Leptospira alstonii serovar Sichuan str. 79601]|uniref:Uncharacterized protein n=1 Tax=Leptospira alstonii serovar Sichuan str. 79601 TaxID=1218565 RepID=M6CJI9_9LEPT|nr:hypothetical protein LEP1GSC194_4182 [Leptospira alstonii serovar Sichuan str. 79601]
MDLNLNQIKNKTFVYYSGTLRQLQQLEFFKPFRISKSLVSLRTDVVIDDKEVSDPCVDDEKIQGNIVDSYDTNAEGFALGRFSDEGRTEWYFSIIPFGSAKYG